MIIEFEIKCFDRNRKITGIAAEERQGQEEREQNLIELENGGTNVVIKR